MTDKEIIKGNILIAEFMGLEMRQETAVLYKRYKGFDGLFHNAQNLSYHTVWDWLMPVVEKIESLDALRNDVVWSDRYYVIDYGRGVEYGVDKKSIGMVWRESHKEPKINAVWKAVIEFIKWHNTQKSELPEPPK